MNLKERIDTEVDQNYNNSKCEVQTKRAFESGARFGLATAADELERQAACRVGTQPDALRLAALVLRVKIEEIKNS